MLITIFAFKRIFQKKFEKPSKHSIHLSKNNHESGLTTIFMSSNFKFRLSTNNFLISLLTYFRWFCFLAKWWAWKVLNFRPHAYQACALTTELQARCISKQLYKLILMNFFVIDDLKEKTDNRVSLILFLFFIFVKEHSLSNP